MRKKSRRYELAHIKDMVPWCLSPEDQHAVKVYVSATPTHVTIGYGAPVDAMSRRGDHLRTTWDVAELDKQLLDDLYIIERGARTGGSSTVDVYVLDATVRRYKDGSWQAGCCKGLTDAQALETIATIRKAIAEVTKEATT